VSKVAGIVLRVDLNIHGQQAGHATDLYKSYNLSDLPTTFGTC
jgi:hypothetical protein